MLREALAVGLVAVPAIGLGTWLLLPDSYVQGWATGPATAETAVSAGRDPALDTTRTERSGTVRTRMGADLTPADSPLPGSLLPPQQLQPPALQQFQVPPPAFRRAGHSPL